VTLYSALPYAASLRSFANFAAIVGEPNKDLSLYRRLMGDLSLCQANSVNGRTWSIVAVPMRQVTHATGDLSLYRRGRGMTGDLTLYSAILGSMAVTVTFPGPGLASLPGCPGLSNPHPVVSLRSTTGYRLGCLQHSFGGR
jgi:hypothetical protein